MRFRVTLLFVRACEDVQHRRMTHTGRKVEAGHLPRPEVYPKKSNVWKERSAMEVATALDGAWAAAAAVCYR